MAVEVAERLLLPVDSPRWNGEELVGRSILLVAEQGLGDTLQFIRFAAMVNERGGHVVVACPKAPTDWWADVRALIGSSTGSQRCPIAMCMHRS